MSESSKHYTVLSPVGTHTTDDVFSVSDEQAKAGVDVKRLLALGVIREAKADEAKNSVAYGQDKADTLRPIPYATESAPAVVATEGENRPTTLGEGLLPKGDYDPTSKPGRKT